MHSYIHSVLCSSVIGFRLVDFFSENIIVSPHGVPDPPSLAQMTFTQFSSITFDWWPNLAICVISALLESLTKDMAQKYGSTGKNFTLGFSVKLSGGVPNIYRTEKR